jgi:hypothetical protein
MCRSVWQKRPYHFANVPDVHFSIWCNEEFCHAGERALLVRSKAKTSLLMIGIQFFER